MQVTSSEPPTDAGRDLEGHDLEGHNLEGRGYRQESIRTILEEGLLPEGVVNRLHALYPQYSGLRQTSAPLFIGKENFSGLRGFREVCEILRENGIEIGFQE